MSLGVKFVGLKKKTNDGFHKIDEDVRFFYYSLNFMSFILLISTNFQNDQLKHKEIQCTHRFSISSKKNLYY